MLYLLYLLIRAVLTKIFQLTSITKNLNDAHEHDNGGHFVFRSVDTAIASAISS